MLESVMVLFVSVSVVARATMGSLLICGVLKNIFVPAICCTPVDMTPRAVDDAFGKLIVCVSPELTTAKSVPLVPVANVCVAPVCPPSDVIPPPPPPETVFNASATVAPATVDVLRTSWALSWRVPTQ